MTVCIQLKKFLIQELQKMGKENISLKGATAMRRAGNLRRIACNVSMMDTTSNKFLMKDGQKTGQNNILLNGVIVMTVRTLGKMRKIVRDVLQLMIFSREN